MSFHLVRCDIDWVTSPCDADTVCSWINDDDSTQSSWVESARWCRWNTRCTIGYEEKRMKKGLQNRWNRIHHPAQALWRFNSNLMLMLDEKGGFAAATKRREKLTHPKQQQQQWQRSAWIFISKDFYEYDKRSRKRREWKILVPCYFTLILISNIL